MGIKQTVVKSIDALSAIEDAYAKWRLNELRKDKETEPVKRTIMGWIADTVIKASTNGKN